MNKLLLILTLALTVNASALTCVVTKTTAYNPDYADSESVVVESLFDQTTTVIDVEFTARTEMTSPDTSAEFIEVANTFDCKDSILFNAKNIYNGFATSCFSKKSITSYDQVYVACRFR